MPQFLAFAEYAGRLLRSTDPRAVFEEVRANSEAARAAAHGSYLHDNGFEKLLLRSWPNGERLLLHHWTASSWEGARSAEHVHNHRWPFAALMMRGGYRSYVVEMGPRAETLYRRFSYGSSQGGEYYALEPAGEARASTIISFDVLPGALNVFSSSMLHRLDLLETPTVTLFLQGAPEHADVTVLAEEVPLTSGRLRAARYSVPEWEHAVGAALGDNTAPTRLVGHPLLVVGPPAGGQTASQSAALPPEVSRPEER